MKKIIGYLTVLTGLLAFQFAQAQDVSINITNLPSVTLGATTPVLITLCNEDPDPITAPGGKLRPQLSVGPNATIIGATNTDGSPLTGFTIQSLSTGVANTIRLLYNDPLPNAECISFHVIVKGVVVSSASNYNATLGFQGPQTPGNNPANDNSGSSLAVTPLPPVATNDAATTPSATPVTISVLTNDTPGDKAIAPAVPATANIVPSSVKLLDPSNNPVTTLTVPNEGIYVVNPNGTVTFTPDVNFSGTTTPVRYTFMDDNSSTSNEATITVTVSALPVTLVSFNVKKEGSVAQLTWATTEETNSDYFEIQHSVGGKNWANVGQVTSNGESKTLRNYTFSHANPVNGENLYRLKMVDKDATFAYSSIRTLKFDGIATADISLYPNPVVDKVFIKDYSGVTGVSIFDVNGRVVYQGASPVQGEISVQNLRSGIYIVRVNRANGSVSSHKIVVSK